MSDITRKIFDFTYSNILKPIVFKFTESDPGEIKLMYDFLDADKNNQKKLLEEITAWHSDKSLNIYELKSFYSLAEKYIKLDDGEEKEKIRTNLWNKFSKTQGDPEKAHNLFKNFSRFTNNTGLDKIIFDNSANQLESSKTIVNGAGFNKNGEYHPTTMKLYGFDEVNIGTVTYDSFGGNPRPRVVRYPKTYSINNWQGLPGIGAKALKEVIDSYGDSHNVSLTINLMATPGKEGDQKLKDLEGTVNTLKDCYMVKRWEVNISCPNTQSKEGRLDARSEYQNMLEDMLKVVIDNKKSSQLVDIKVSPDLDREGVKDILNAYKNMPKGGRIVVGNTTTDHDEKYIPVSPGRGGGSGDAVYKKSLEVQKIFYEEMKEIGIENKYELIAVGGIRTTERLDERLSYGASGIQLFTPFVMEGPGILPKFRKHLNKHYAA